MKILIDNGHGRDTAGKRSPNGVLQEWKYTREIAQQVVNTLHTMGYNAELLTPENEDIPLRDRVDRIKEWCKIYGSSHVLLISIHLNAAGNGQWMSGTGGEAYTYPYYTKADELASCLYKAAQIACNNNPSLKIHTDMIDGDPDKEARFYILRRTPCPAVLTENFFMNNKTDYAYLLSDEGKDALLQLHVCGIIEMLWDSRKGFHLS